MSIVVIDNQVVHYEVFGRGRPVVFLHGWLGSWRYWFPTMEVLSDQFRTYSFDFWGFGDSRHQTSQVGIQTYSDQVIRFLDELGIERAMLVGHSMGGMVAIKTAIQYPDRITSVATVGAPIVGDSLSWLLKLLDRPLLADSFAYLPWLRRYIFKFFLGETNDLAVNEVLDDSVKSNANTLRRAISSMMRTDLRPELSRLKIPSMIVHGGRDDIVNPNQADLFDAIDSSEVVLMPSSRHFPFLDEAEIFNDVLLRFLKQQQPRAPALQPRIAMPEPFLMS